MQSSIKVKDSEKSIKFNVKNGKLPLSIITTYFPHANGLTYNVENEKFGVNLLNNELQLVDGIMEYEVFYSESSKDVAVKNAKKRRIDEIMAVIEGNDKRIEENECYNAGLPVRKKKEIKKGITVGWKHKFKARNEYIYMKEPIGGIKHLSLNKNMYYTYDEMKELCLNAVKNEDNEFYLNEAEIKLGSFSAVVSDFEDENGRKCDFWTYSRCIKSKNNQIRLYLYTKPIDKDYNADLSERIEMHIANNISPIAVPSTSVGADNQEKKEQKNSFKLPKPSIFAKENNSKKSHLFIKSSLQFLIDESKLLRILQENNVQSKSSSSQVHSFKDDKPNIEELELSVPLINEEDIMFSENVLGRGGFGTVKKATWLHSDVAVKIIKWEDNVKYILREIKMMDIVRHPNIIRLMAISTNASHIFIIMEYFDSVSLKILIFNEKIKKDYNLSEKKKHYVALQICTAITFLHGLKPAIFHKDLKPENILVNINYITKVCDLGLSKLSVMPSSLTTTVGHNHHGTILYMAPEILLHNMEGRAPSDIWSLGCVLVELYSENSAWNLADAYNWIESLKLGLICKQIPDLSKVPIALREVVASCFEYDVEKRTAASSLLSTLKNLRN